MINILGKDRKIRFNIFGIEQMQNKVHAGSEIGNIYALIWGGLEGARYANDEERDYSFSDVIDAIDAMDRDARKLIVDELNKLLLESQAFKSLVASAEPEPGKKKVSKKRSTST